MAILALVAVCILVYYIQSNLYRRFWSKSLSLSLEFSGKDCFEGEGLFLTQVVSNAKLLPMPWLCVKIQLSKKLQFINEEYDSVSVSDYVYRNDLYSIMFYQTIKRKLPFICTGRGFFTIRSAELVSNNILINQKLVASVDCNTSLTVYPRLIDPVQLQLPFEKIYGAVLTKRFINPDCFEFRGMREYMPLDSFKSINSKASARTGTLMVNLYDYTSTQEVIIYLNLEAYNRWSSDFVFEESIRIAASLAKQLTEKGISVGLVSNGRDIETDSEVNIRAGSDKTHLMNIFNALARIDLSKTPNNIDTIKEGYTVFISANCNDEAVAFYNRLQAGQWIVPVFNTDKVDLDIEFIRWDVADRTMS